MKYKKVHAIALGNTEEAEELIDAVTLARA